MTDSRTCDVDGCDSPAVVYVYEAMEDRCRDCFEFDYTRRIQWRQNAD